MLSGDIMRWYRGLSKLNLSAASWQSITLIDVDSNAPAAAHQDQIFYTTSRGLYSLETAGTNRMKGVPVLDWSDLTVKDGVPMGTPASFLFDSEGNILFADESHMLLRKITFT